MSPSNYIRKFVNRIRCTNGFSILFHLIKQTLDKICLSSRALPGPKLLEWNLDSRLKWSIEAAERSTEGSTKDIVLKRRPFKNFGKTDIQKLKVNPDTFVQMALQLAYFRLHKKPGESPADILQ